ncbi:hypothetical protein ACX3P0_17595 [Mesorhizobium sp. A556]
MTERGAVELPSRRSPEKVARARQLRQGGNMAEALLWNDTLASDLRFVFAEASEKMEGSIG